MRVSLYLGFLLPFFVLKVFFPAMPRPLVALIDIAAMRSNLALARAAMPDTKVWAVVKADAYGHGLQNALHGFAEADGLSLIEFEAAVRLREMGWEKPIMMLEGLFDPSDWALADHHHLQLVVHCHEQLPMLAAATVINPVDVHLKINTGMNRLGFAPDQVPEVYARLRAMRAVNSISLMTHFANADLGTQARLPVATQLARFKAASQHIEATLGDGSTIASSLANSAATLLHGELHGTWMRSGVMLYGGAAGSAPAASFGLVPAMHLQSTLIAVQHIAAGDVVGYGSLFMADKAMRVGVVACGYADGYPRHAPTGTPVLVDGVRTRLIGRVSMDMIAVDLDPVPLAGYGSPVTLWGDGLAIDEVANAAGTIGYELMCAVAPRVKRQVIS